MPKPDIELLVGESGKVWPFNVYPSTIRFNDFIPGVYLISTEDPAGGAEHVFIGETDNIDLTLSEHEKQSCFDQHGYNRIAFYKNASQEVRRSIVDDLASVLDPVCNRDGDGD